jgi:hypothetical protein
MEGRGTVFLGVIPFRDFGCGRAKLAVMVEQSYIGHYEQSSMK